MNTILNDLFYGNVCVITDVNVKNNRELKEVRKKLIILERKIQYSNDENKQKIFEEIKFYYKKLLLINLRESYIEGLKTGYKLAIELKSNN